MKNIIIFLLVLVLSLIITSSVVAGGFNKSGRTAFQFLKIGVGARQTALGEASITSVRDINSIFWNPAGITGVQAREASFSYNHWFADMDYLAGAAGIRLKGIGVVGISYAVLNYGDLQEALTPIVGGSSDSRTGNLFTGHDLMAGLSFAREFTDQLSIGATVKIVQEKLFTYTVNLLAFDVGTNYDIAYKGLRLAMSAQNFGSSVKWLENSNRDEGYDIPLIYRIGFSFNLIHQKEGFFTAGVRHQVRLNMEAVHTNDYGDRFHFGGEYWYNDFIALRAGYRINYDEGNFSFGIGVKHRVSNFDVGLDFAYVSYEFLTSPYRLTLVLAF